MAEVAVRDRQNQPVRTIQLPDEVFAAPMRKHLLYEAVRHYRNSGRAGTHDTKNRKEVSGGTRKLWKQKHTGRARMGDNRSPLWRHGGTVHGPTPRDYGYRLPRAVRLGALCTALSDKLRGERLVVVDTLALEEPKTKGLRKLLEEGLGIRARVLLVCEEGDRNLVLAARNNPLIKTVRPLGLNVYDLLDHEYVVATEEALGHVAKALAASRRAGASKRGTEREAGE